MKGSATRPPWEDADDDGGFPLGALPTPFATWADAQSFCRQVPIELPAMVALGLAAGAIQRRYKVELLNFEQELGLYVLLTLASGEHKTSVMKDATRCIRQYEWDLIRQWEDYEADRPDAAPRPGLFMDDTTPEARAVVLAAQGERSVIATSEAGPLDSLRGRYGSSAGGEMELMLRGFDGEALRVDRISRESVNLHRPCLTVVCCVQPIVLSDLFKVPAVMEKGLLARFLLSQPPSRVGFREQDVPAVPVAVQSLYDSTMRTLWSSMPTDGSGVLRLSEDAAKLLSLYESTVETELRPSGRYRSLGLVPVANRAAGQAGRLAAVIHVVERLRTGWEMPIDEATMAAGIRLSRYFLTEAERLYPLLLRGAPLEDHYHGEDGQEPPAAPEIRAWLRGCPGGKASLRQLFYRFHHRHDMRRIADVRDCAVWMDNHGQVLYWKEYKGFGTGRPVEWIELPQAGSEEE